LQNIIISHTELSQIVETFSISLFSPTSFSQTAKTIWLQGFKKLRNIIISHSFKVPVFGYFIPVNFQRWFSHSGYQKFFLIYLSNSEYFISQNFKLQKR